MHTEVFLLERHSLFAAPSVYSLKVKLEGNLEKFRRLRGEKYDGLG